MFTGIVEEIGEIKAIHKAGNLICLDVKAKRVVRGAKHGDSISVNGVCLTLTKINSNTLSFDMMKETIKCTTLGRLNTKAKVNLEGALMTPVSWGFFILGHGLFRASHTAQPNALIPTSMVKAQYCVTLPGI